MTFYLIKLVADCLFILLSAFLFFVIVLSYFLKGLSLIFVSILLSTIATLVYLILILRKNNKTILKNSKWENMQNLLDGFCFLNRKKAINELSICAKKQNIAVKTNKSNTYFDNKRVVAIFNYSGVSPEDFISIYSKKDTILFCNFLSKDAEKLAEKCKNIEIYNIEKTYDFVLSSGYRPKFNLSFDKAKPTFLDKVKLLFLNLNHKNMLKIAFLLTFLSFFSFCKVYYLIVAFVFLMLSIISKYIKNNNL